MVAAEVSQGLAIFGTILLSLALLAAVCTGCWLLLFHVTLKQLPPVQEALGLKKRDKPTLEEMRAEIEALKRAHQRAGQEQQQHLRGSGGATQPGLSAGDRGLRARR